MNLFYPDRSYLEAEFRCLTALVFAEWFVKYEVMNAGNICLQYLRHQLQITTLVVMATEGSNRLLTPHYRTTRSVFWR